MLHKLLYLYCNFTFPNTGFNSSSAPNTASKLNEPEEKRSETFSLGHLWFEGHFKDGERNAAPADVHEDFIVYLYEEERAGVRVQQGKEVKFDTTLRRRNLRSQSPQMLTKQGGLAASAVLLEVLC